MITNNRCPNTDTYNFLRVWSIVIIYDNTKGIPIWIDNNDTSKYWRTLTACCATRMFKTASLLRNIYTSPTVVNITMLRYPQVATFTWPLLEELSITNSWVQFHWPFNHAEIIYITPLSKHQLFITLGWGLASYHEIRSLPEESNVCGNSKQERLVISGRRR